MFNHVDFSLGHTTPDSDRIDTANQETQQQQHPATHVLASSDVNNNQATHRDSRSPVDEYMPRPTTQGRLVLPPLLSLLASTTIPVPPVVIDPHLATAGMESNADTSVGGGGAGNNKKARVAVGENCAGTHYFDGGYVEV